MEGTESLGGVTDGLADSQLHGKADETEDLQPVNSIIRRMSSIQLFSIAVRLIRGIHCGSCYLLLYAFYIQSHRVRLYWRAHGGRLLESH